MYWRHFALVLDSCHFGTHACVSKQETNDLRAYVHSSCMHSAQTRRKCVVIRLQAGQTFLDKSAQAKHPEHFFLVRGDGEEAQAAADRDVRRKDIGWS